MNRIGGSSLIILAIIMVVLGALLIIGIDLLKGLITFTGYSLIAVGIVVGIVGLVQMLSRNKGSSNY